jgi:hypothetical protein
MKRIDFKALKRAFHRHKLKPVKMPQMDWGELLHVIFNAVLPFALLVLVNLELTLIAIALVFLSKWRMFAIRTNHLPANIRANATDLVVKLSALSFMIQLEELGPQLIVATAYAVWLLLIKPQTSKAWISVQALMSQFIGITALMLLSQSDAMSELMLLLGIWVVVYVTSYHFLSSFDEVMSKVIAKIWALLGLELAWLFIHWNLAYFSIIPQYALVQAALSLVAGDMYYAKQNDKFDASRLRFYIIATSVIVVVLIISADWNGQII